MTIYKSGILLRLKMSRFVIRRCLPYKICRIIIHQYNSHFWLTWGLIALQVCCPGILVYLFLWLLSCKLLWGGGLIRWIFWLTVVHLGRSTMPGWYRACQIGRSEQQVTCNSLLHLEFRVHFWLVYSCVQFAVPADWEAPGWILFPVGELSQNWSFSFFICWIK